MNDTNYFAEISQKVFKEYDIDQDKPLYEGHVKPVPREWIETVLLLTIDKITSNMELAKLEKLIDKKTIILHFKNQDDLQEFQSKLQIEILNTLNDYIRNVKNDNPKNYHRAIIFESKVENLRLVINY